MVQDGAGPGHVVQGDDSGLQRRVGRCVLGGGGGHLPDRSALEGRRSRTSRLLVQEVGPRGPRGRQGSGPDRRPGRTVRRAHEEAVRCGASPDELQVLARPVEEEPGHDS